MQMSMQDRCKNNIIRTILVFNWMPLIVHTIHFNIMNILVVNVFLFIICIKGNKNKIVK